MITMVIFGWWSFNTLIFWVTLYFQQILGVSPLGTSIRFIPLVLSGVVVNIAGGYLLNHVPGLPIIVVGLCGNIAASALYALIDTSASYWAMAFVIVVIMVGADLIYPIGILHICIVCNEESQSLAGGIFNVATRLGTSLGLAVTSSIAEVVSERYHNNHPEQASTSPAVLLPGFRAAGWACFAAAVISASIAIVFLREIGVVGKASKETPASSTMEKLET